MQAQVKVMLEKGERMGRLPANNWFSRELPPLTLPSLVQVVPAIEPCWYTNSSGS